MVGVEGTGLTVTLRLELAPFPQALVPKTVTLPEEADELKSTWIELVFAPEVMVAPAGTVQVYPVALVIVGTV